MIHAQEGPANEWTKLLLNTIPLARTSNERCQDGLFLLLPCRWVGFSGGIDGAVVGLDFHFSLLSSSFSDLVHRRLHESDWYGQAEGDGGKGRRAGPQGVKRPATRSTYLSLCSNV